MSSGPAQRWRIGVLATRVGVSETLLRAWEVRYGLLSPQPVSYTHLTLPTSDLV